MKSNQIPNIATLVEYLTPLSAMKELKHISGLLSYYTTWSPKFSEKAALFLHTQCFSLSEVL